MATNYTIYKGHVWREHGSNRLLLTLSGTASGVLQAAIPLWISLVGPLTWIIIKYAWFRRSVLRRTRWGTFYTLYYRQKQLLLRNGNGDLGTVMDSLSLFIAWMGHGKWAAAWRTVPLLIIALLFWCFWQGAGILSSKIWSSTPNLGLVRSSTCGYNFLQGPNATLAFRRSGLAETLQAETYTSQCYRNGTSGACNVYAKPAIVYNSSNAACPFASNDICISTNSTPLLLDSGPINSHIDLGINAAPGDRVVYQKINTCSPVHNTKFVQIVNANETDEAYYWPPETRLQRYFYGPIRNTNFSYTFEYSEWTPLDNIPYDIQGVLYNPGPEGTENAWAINTSFTDRTDGDISILFFTANSVASNFSIYDPFFLTGDSFSEPVGDEVMTLYPPAFFVNSMGCIEQHRFCNPTAPGLCTPYSAYLDFGDVPGPLDTLRFNAAQLATAQRIAAGLLPTLTFNSVANRRGAALLASRTVSDLLQTRALPADQWRAEVENWFAVSLAKLQQAVLEYATGPLDPDITPYVQFPTDTDQRKMCYNQLVQLPSKYANFDFTGVLVVFLVGALFVAIGLLFEPVADWCAKRWRRGRGVVEWREDGKFQLLRRMYQAQGVALARWERVDKGVPITTATV